MLIKKCKKLLLVIVFLVLFGGIYCLKVQGATSGTLLDEVNILDDNENMTYSFSLDNTSKVCVNFADGTYGNLNISIKNIDSGTEVFNQSDYILFDNTQYDVTLEAGNYSLTLSTYDYEDINYHMVVSYARVIDTDHPYYSLSETEKTMYTGRTGQLSVSVLPEDMDIPAASWSSDNTSVVQVSQFGELTAVKSGNATITANIAGTQLKCKVTVKNPVYTLNKSSLTLYTSKSYTLKVTVSPSNYGIGTIKWTTSNPVIATVSSSGVVKGIGNGTATISAQIGTQKVSCKVTVKNPVYTLNKSSLAIYISQSYTLKVAVSPTSYGISKIKWTTSNPAVATVSSKGVVKGIGKGTATISAQIGTQKVKCKVTVRNMTINVTNKTVYVKRTVKLSVLGGTGKISWKTSNKKVATVTSSGVVKGVAPGKAVIYAIRNGKKLKCNIKVTYIPETGETIDEYYYYMYRYDAMSKEIKIKGQCTITLTANNYGEYDSYDVLDISIYDNDTCIWSKYLDPGESVTKTVNLHEGNHSIYISSECDFSIHVKGTIKPQLSSTKISIGKGNKKTIKTIAVKNSVKWTTSNSKIATVDSKGVVRAKKNGTCKITCTLKNGKKLVATVNVINPVTAKVESVEDDYIYNDCNIKIYNNTSKKVTYVELRITQYDNRGKKIDTPYNSYCYNDDIKANSSVSACYWVNEKSKKCKVTIVKVWYSDGTTWKP